MNDVFIERLIKRKLLPLCIALRIISIILILVSVLLVLQIGSLGVIIETIVCIGAFYIFKYTSIEYEYCYVAGEFIIDKVMGKAKRKRCIKIDMNTVEFRCANGTFNPVIW